MDREPRIRWTDDRLDDLADAVKANTEHLRALQNMVAAHDLQLLEWQRERNARSEHNFALYLVLLTVILTSIGGLAVNIITSSQQQPVRVTIHGTAK